MILKRYWFTLSLSALLLVIYTIQLWVSSIYGPDLLLESGKKVNALIWEGQIWRLGTMTFLHYSWDHLLQNILAFLLFGLFFEHFAGSRRTALVFFASGLFGSIASFLFEPRSAAGASAAIWGIYGALLMCALLQPKFPFWHKCFVIAVPIVPGAFGQIDKDDLWGHLSGLFCGVVLGLIFYFPKSKMNYLIQSFRPPGKP